MSKLKEKLINRLDETRDAEFEIISEDEVTVLPPASVDYLEPSLAVNLTEAREKLRILKQFVKEIMSEGEDYGIIPGCQKPSLYKPGAEKLCDLFGFSKHVEITGRVEDWGKPFLHYEVKVTLINKRSGNIEAEGIGSCNSMEKKFIKKDSYSISNTLLKMAKKRAFVDAVLSATRTSGLFTQDIEDGENIQDNKNPITQGQLQRLNALAKGIKLKSDEAKKILASRYQLGDARLLSSEQADDLIRFLQRQGQEQA